MVAAKGVYWWPEALRSVADEPDALAHFAYVVLEELVDDLVELMAWSWPLADDEGHLFWPSGDEHHPSTAVVGRELLRHQLYRPSRVQRSPRLGDVYAVTRRGAGWQQTQPVEDVRTLFEGPLYDISADAREAAKLAYHGAVATVRTSRTHAEVDRRLLAQAAERRAHLTAKQLTLAPPPSSRRRGATP